MNYFIYDSLTRLVKEHGNEKAAEIAFAIADKEVMLEDKSERFSLWNKELPKGTKLKGYNKLKGKFYGETATQLELANFFANRELRYEYEFFFNALNLTLANIKKSLSEVFTKLEASENEFGWDVVTYYKEVHHEYEYSEVEASVALTPKGLYRMNYDHLLPYDELKEKYVDFTLRIGVTDVDFAGWVEKYILDEGY